MRCVHHRRCVPAAARPRCSHQKQDRCTRTPPPAAMRRVLPIEADEPISFSELLDQRGSNVAAAPGNDDDFFGVIHRCSRRRAERRYYFFRYLTSAATPSTSTTTTRIHTSPDPPIIEFIMSVMISISFGRRLRARYCSWTRFLDEAADLTRICKHHRRTVALHARTDDHGLS